MAGVLPMIRQHEEKAETMKPITMLTAALLVLSLLVPATVHAADSYTASLAAADAALGSGNADSALRELSAALDQAATPGERALALAKKGYVLAFLKLDYAAARQAVDEAMTIEMEPVAKVTALQALAQCQIKADQDLHGALANLETALSLPGVEWAHPGLVTTQADCYREILQLDEAMSAYRRVTLMADADPALKAGAWLNIGYIYQYDRKDASAAREAYAKAVALKPDLKPEVKKHLADLP